METRRKKIGFKRLAAGDPNSDVEEDDFVEFHLSRFNNDYYYYDARAAAAMSLSSSSSSSFSSGSNRKRKRPLDEASRTLDGGGGGGESSGDKNNNKDDNDDDNNEDKDNNDSEDAALESLSRKRRLSARRSVSGGGGGGGGRHSRGLAAVKSGRSSKRNALGASTPQHYHHQQQQQHAMEAWKSKSGGKQFPRRQSRVEGGDYQVSEIPLAGSHSPQDCQAWGDDATERYDLLWDPQAANAANMLDFVQTSVPWHQREAIFSLVHQHHYQSDELMPLVHNSSSSNNTREWTTAQQALFREMVFKNRKNFVRMAQALNKTVSQVLTFYMGTYKSTCYEYALTKALCRQDRKDRLEAKRAEMDDYCRTCGEGGDLLICDVCEDAYHLSCLRPPLAAVPEGNWDCDKCLRQKVLRLRDELLFGNNNDKNNDGQGQGEEEEDKDKDENKKEKKKGSEKAEDEGASDDPENDHETAKPTGNGAKDEGSSAGPMTGGPVLMPSTPESPNATTPKENDQGEEGDDTSGKGQRVGSDEGPNNDKPQGQEPTTDGRQNQPTERYRLIQSAAEALAKNIINILQS